MIEYLITGDCKINVGFAIDIYCIKILVSIIQSTHFVCHTLPDFGVGGKN
jgi:hypothetical protein